MEIDWTKELADQLSFHWDNVLRPRLAGLTDDQYRWEPVTGMWSIRPRGEATAPMAVGAGDAVIDYAIPEPTPPPLTTIAWRLGHIAVVFGQRAANHFGGPPVDYQDVDWPLTAAGMLELVDRHHDAWMAGVEALGADDLARPCGPSEGPYAAYPFAALVLHITREVLHHGAEVALLLDLYTHRHELGGHR
jgi:hypothetical protein